MNLQKILIKLQSFSQNPKLIETNITITINEIFELCFVRQASESEKWSKISLIFDPQIGIATFFEKTIQHQNRPFVIAKKYLLYFLAKFIRVNQKRILSYFEVIKSLCMNTFRREKSNTVKLASLSPLFALLSLKSRHLNSSKVDPQQMMDFYMKEYIELNKKLSQSVKGRLLELFGKLSDLFPLKLESFKQEIFDILVENLNEQFKQDERWNKTPELQTISGAFKCAIYLFKSFPEIIEQNEQNNRKIFSHVLTSISPNQDLKRYKVVRLGLRLFSVHSQLFRNQIFHHREMLLNQLFKLYCVDYKKFKTDSGYAVEQFFRNISEQLIQRAESQESVDIFENYMEQLNNRLMSEKSSIVEITWSLRGIGALASAIHTFHYSKDISDIFLKLSHHCYFKLTESVNDQFDYFNHIHNILETFSSLVSFTDSSKISMEIIENVNQMLVLFFQNFPGLVSQYNFKSLEAFVQLLFSLYSKGTPNFLKLLTRIIPFGLKVSLCEHRDLNVSNKLSNSQSPPKDGEHLDQLKSSNSTKLDLVTIHHNYIVLWRSFFYAPLLDDPSSDQVIQFHQLIFTEFITTIMSFLELIEECDMQSQSNIDDYFLSSQNFEDQGHSYFSGNILIFFNNLVQLCSSVLLFRNYSDFFLPWIYSFSEKIVFLSSRYPLVSSYYEMMTIITRICHKHFMFIQKRKSSIIQIKSNQKNKMEITESQEQINTDKLYNLFSKFLEELLTRIKHYKDTLLYKCMLLVLSMPDAFIDIGRFVPVLLSTFKLGLDYPHAASIALKTLESWLERIPENLDPFLNSILPSLERFLRQYKQSEDMLLHLSSLQLPRKRKYFAPKKQVFDKDDENEFATKSNKKINKLRRMRPDIFFDKSEKIENLQLRVLKLLGKLGGKNVNILDIHQTNLTGVSEKYIAWDIEQRLMLDVLLNKCNFVFVLDPLLRKIVELSERAYDPQAKFAACQVLYWIVLYMVGIHSFDPQTKTSAQTMQRETLQFWKLYQKIFPIILRLSVDDNLEISKMFSSLVSQLIHWFTKSSLHESKETMCLLDAIIAGVCNDSNGSIRDLSSGFLSEFYEWTVKNSISSPVKKGKNGEKFSSILPHLESLLRRILALIQNTDPFKRLGGAMVLQRIIPQMKMDSNVLNRYALVMMTGLLFSLKFADSEALELKVALETGKAVDLLSKVISNDRQILSTYENVDLTGENPTTSLAEWLFANVSIAEMECRRKCQELFLVLSSSGEDNLPRIWIEKNVRPENLAVSFENQLPKIGKKAKKIESFFESPQALLPLLRALEGALDANVWLIKNALVEKTHYLVYNLSVNSALLNWIQILFENYFKIIDLLSVNEAELSDVSVKNNTIQKSLSSKLSLVCVLVFDFFLCYQDDLALFISKTNDIFTLRFFQLLFMMILLPNSCGIDTHDSSLVSKLKKNTRKMCQSFLRIFKQSEHRNLKSFFDQSLTSVLSQKQFSLDFQRIFNEKQSFDLVHLISGFCFFHSAGILPVFLWKTDLGQGFHFILTELEHHFLSPTKITLMQKIVELLLRLGDFNNELLSYLQDQSIVNTTTRSALLYNYFQKQLREYVFKNFDWFSHFLFENKNASPVLFSLLLDIITTNSNNDNFISNSCLNNLHYLKKWARNKQIEFPQNCVKLLNSIFILHISRSKNYPNFENQESESESESEMDIEQNENLYPQKQVIESPLIQHDPKSETISLRTLQPQSQHFQDLKKIIIRILSRDSSENEEMLLKTSAIDFSLNFFLKYKISEYQDVSGQIQQFINKISTEKTTESQDSKHFANIHLTTTNIIRSLFNSFSFYKSPLAVHTLLSLRKLSSTYKLKIQKAFSDLISSSNDENASQIFLSLSDTLFQNNINQEHKKEVTFEILVPCILKISQKSAIDLVSPILKKLVKILSAKIDPQKHDTSQIKQIIGTQICAFSVLEALYSKCSSEAIYRDLNPILFKNRKNLKGNEMNKKLSKIGHLAHSISLSNTIRKAIGRDMKKQYYRSAFKFLAQIFMTTQKDSTLFTQLFFSSEDPKKKLWEHLVDCKKSFVFEPETNFKIIHKEDSDETDYQSFPKDPKSDPKLKRRNILNDDEEYEDLTQMEEEDHQEPNLRRIKSNHPQELSMDANIQSDLLIQDSVESCEYDLDELNQNPIMETFGKLINFMQNNFYSNQLLDFENSQDFNKIPEYVAKMHSKFTDPKTKENVKWFITKLVLNNYQIFHQYSSHWFVPLMQFQMKNSRGSGFHYINATLQRQFIDFLLKNLFHHNSLIRHSNLDIIHAFFTRWSNWLIPDVSIVQQYLKSENNKEITIGLNLLGIIGCSSEVIGMLLQEISDLYKNDDSHFFKKFQIKLNQIYEKKDYERFLICIYKSGPRYIKIFHQYSFQLLQLLPNVSGEFKIIILEIILLCVYNIPNLYNTIKPNLNHLFSHSDQRIQSLILQILHKIIFGIPQQDIQDLVPKLHEIFIVHHNQKCREDYLNLLIETDVNLRRMKANENQQKLIIEIQKYLIYGLKDPNPKIQKKMLEFWDESHRLSLKPTLRILQTLNQLYLPDLEENWLGYSTALLLKLIKRSNLYHKPMFNSLEKSEIIDSKTITQDHNQYLDSSSSTLTTTTTTTKSTSTETETSTKRTKGKSILSKTIPPKNEDSTIPLNNNNNDTISYDETIPLEQNEKNQYSQTIPMETSTTQTQINLEPTLVNGQETLEQMDQDDQSETITSLTIPQDMDATLPQNPDPKSSTLIEPTLQISTQSDTQFDTLSSDALFANNMKTINLQSQRTPIRQLNDEKTEKLQDRKLTNSLAKFPKNIEKMDKSIFRTKSIVKFESSFIFGKYSLGYEIDPVEKTTKYIGAFGSELNQSNAGQKIPNPDSLLARLDSISTELWRKFRRFSKISKSREMYFYATKSSERARKKQRYIEKLKSQQRNQKMQLDDQDKFDSNLPNVQIKMKTLVDSLEILSSQDPDIARLLYQSIFKGIYKTLKKTDQKSAFVNEIKEAISSMMQKTKMFVPPFIACIQSLGFCSTEMTPDIHLIGETSYKSFNFSTGIMVIENFLANENTLLNMKMEAMEFEKTGEKSDEKEPQKIWLELSRLYSLLGEEDVVTGLSEKISTSKFAKQAIGDQMKGNYKKALENYNKALEFQNENQIQINNENEINNENQNQINNENEINNENQNQINENQITKELSQKINLHLYEDQMWSLSRLECLAKLQKWDDVSSDLDRQFNTNLNQLFDTKYQDSLLKYFIISHLRNEDKKKKLTEILFANDLNQENMKIIEKFYSLELALLDVEQGNFEKTRSKIMFSYERFIHDWTNIHPLAQFGRHHKLQQLQRIIEIQEFLLLANSLIRGSIKKEHRKRKLKEVLGKWSRRFPSEQFDDVVTWDLVLFQRKLFYEQIYSIFQKISENETFETEENQTETEVESLSLSDSDVSRSYFVTEYSIFQLDDSSDLIEKKQPQDSLSKISQILFMSYQNDMQQLARYSIQQSNFVVAKNAINKVGSMQFPFECDSFVPSIDVETRKFVLVSEIKLKRLKAKQKSGEDVEKTIGKLLGLLQMIHKSKEQQIFRENDAFYSKLQYYEGLTVHDILNLIFSDKKNCEICSRYLRISSQEKEKEKEKEKETEKLKEKEKEKEFDQANYRRITQLLVQKGTNSFQQSVKTQETDNTKNSAKRLAHYHLTFALFCDQILREYEKVEQNKTGDFQINKIDYIKEIVQNILKSIELSSTKAIDRFPRVLELVGNHVESKVISQLFSAKTQEIPSWMFTKWISQMVAVLNKREGPMILDIISRIAKDYPQCLYFPLQISQQSYDFNTKQMINSRLSGFLSNPLLEKFTHHLELLTEPHLVFSDYMDEIERQIGKYDSKSNHSFIKEKIKHLISNLFVFDQKENGDWRNNFAHWNTLFTNIFGKNGKLLLEKISLSSFKRKRKQIFKEMVSEYEKLKNTSHRTLREYSLWLSNFKQSSFSVEYYIEIPGQYNGQSIPDPKKHSKIVSFNETLQVMKSLRLPKRLVINGNDGKEYPFLVKGGEDLRLDQRIEQLFTVMNQIMQSDPICCQRRLKIQTYQVVPVTPRVGLIEWLDNTKPFHSMVGEKAPKPKNNQKFVFDECVEMYRNWLLKFSKKNQNIMEMYWELLSKTDNRTETVENFKRIQNHLKWDLMRKSIISLSESKESFLAIRAQFARTLSSFSVAGYILGIGDRHLKNFLVDNLTGSVIGIDFGYSFGTGVQLIPIPELVPFRMTPQLTNLFRPLETNGIIQQTMLHTLRVLRENQEILLNVMDIFLKEPLLDWYQFADKISKLKKDKKISAKPNWFPLEKIEIAKRKLDGDHPSEIMNQELDSSVHTDKPFYPQIKNIVFGDPSFNFRAQISQKVKLSVHDQVQCLLDQATDPNLLGRMYVGFQAWV
ncbi:DNA-dependent protein kinase catalytic subunit [Anaeramoeba ignava]|uniref:DNA-dependent protein kinase catalytic subunit n=1 Tax=Anaeramoeba ignava TaxID=1746090 RepID=A0A9Q0REI6_ANAIG|nr:DNA-dependent protein kinase catalytic subunit [Anaeramoeba ignava]